MHITVYAVLLFAAFLSFLVAAIMFLPAAPHRLASFFLALGLVVQVFATMLVVLGVIPG